MTRRPPWWRHSIRSEPIKIREQISALGVKTPYRFGRPGQLSRAASSLLVAYRAARSRCVLFTAGSVVFAAISSSSDARRAKYDSSVSPATGGGASCARGSRFLDIVLKRRSRELVSIRKTETDACLSHDGAQRLRVRTNDIQPVTRSRGAVVAKVRPQVFVSVAPCRSAGNARVQSNRDPIPP